MKALITILLLTVSVFATLYSVNTLDDTTDGSCSDGDCSLRDAMLLSTDNDIINIDINGTITLSRHLPDINGTTLTINGGSKNNLIIDGNDSCRPFKVYQGNLTLSNLSIVDGNTTNEPTRIYDDEWYETEDHGGAIFLSRSGSLTLNTVGFSNNKAEINGGAIHTNGSLFINNCTFYNNKGGGMGGAINHQGTLEINASSFTINKSDAFGGAVSIFGSSFIAESYFLLNQSDKGAGIYIGYKDPDTHTIIDSDFSSNISTGYGGAIYSKSALTLKRSLLVLNTALRGAGICLYGTNPFDNNVTIINSTISNNIASDDGGGIYMYNTVTNPVKISHTSIVKNKAGMGSGGISHQFGNLYIKNTIVSYNIIDNENNTQNFDCKSIVPDNFHSNGNNIFSYNSMYQACTFTTDDINSTQEQVSSLLADNGGKTKTHALREDAIANNGATCYDNDGVRISEDQRGFRRSSTQCDIGAYEEADLNSGLPTMLYLLLN